MKIEKLKNNLLYLINNKVSKSEHESSGEVGIGYYNNNRFQLNKELKEGKIDETEYNEIIDLYNKVDGRKRVTT